MVIRRPDINERIGTDGGGGGGGVLHPQEDRKRRNCDFDEATQYISLGEVVKRPCKEKGCEARQELLNLERKLGFVVSMGRLGKSRKIERICCKNHPKKTCQKP